MLLLSMCSLNPASVLITGSPRAATEHTHAGYRRLYVFMFFKFILFIMNIYVINEVLIDYSSGMAVIAASDLARCRELFLAEFDWPARHQDQFDASISMAISKSLKM